MQSSVRGIAGRARQEIESEEQCDDALGSSWLNDLEYVCQSNFAISWENWSLFISRSDQAVVTFVSCSSNRLSAHHSQIQTFDRVAPKEKERVYTQREALSHRVDTPVGEDC